MELKQKKVTPPTIYSYEIFILVKHAWSHSSVHPTLNKSTITDCGWFTLNCALLLNNKLRMTMADEEKISKLKFSTIFILSSNLVTAVPPPPPPTNYTTTAIDTPV